MRVVGYINIVVQFLFIRLSVAVDKETREVKELAILGFPLPFTGWWSDYKFLGKSKRVHLPIKAPKWLLKTI